MSSTPPPFQVLTSSASVSAPDRRVVWICVNGINAWPGDAEGWTDRAVTWLHLHAFGHAEKFEYATDALTRRIWQQYRAQGIARMAEFYIRAGYEVIFVAHSNGADLVERVLKLAWPVKFRSAHLFAPACDGEQLAHALATGQLGTAHLYGSTNDRALMIARASQVFFGWAGLGYGDLGRRVLEFCQEAKNAIAHEENDQTHGSWFERGENFERTMRALLTNELTTPTAPLA